MTLEQFLAWEELQERRFEFDGFQPVAMDGVTIAHSGIQTNLLAALGIRLRGRLCRPRGSNLKIRLAERIRYPDAFVACTPVAPRATWVEDPVVVFEILSESTANTDIVLKNAEYRAALSIRRYVILQQTHAGATVFSHQGDAWAAEMVSGEDAVLSLPEIGVEIPLAEIYAELTLAGNAPQE